MHISNPYNITNEQMKTQNMLIIMDSIFSPNDSSETLTNELFVFVYLYVASHSIVVPISWNETLNFKLIFTYWYMPFVMSKCHLKKAGNTNSTKHLFSPWAVKTFIQQFTIFHSCCPHPWPCQKTQFNLLSQSHLRFTALQLIHFNSVTSRLPPTPASPSHMKTKDIRW